MATVSITVEASKFDAGSNFVRIRRGNRFISLNPKAFAKLLEKRLAIEEFMCKENTDGVVAFKETLSTVLSIEVTSFKGENYLSFRKNGGYLNIAYSDWEYMNTNAVFDTLAPTTTAAPVPKPLKRVYEDASTQTTSVIPEKRVKTLDVTASDLQRYVMLILLRRSVRTVAEASCDGCLEGYLSQKDHKCLNEAEYMHELYFEEAYNHAERKLVYIHSKVINAAGLDADYLLEPEEVNYKALRANYFEEIPIDIELLVEDCVRTCGLRI